MWTWEPIAETVELGHAVVRASNPRETSWYKGHFPSMPVLPGVAILALIEQTVRTVLSADVTELHRVRFKSIVRPEATTLRVRLSKSQTAERTWDFVVEADGVSACKGTFRV